VTEIGTLAAVRAVHIASTVALAGAFAFRLLVLPRSASRVADAADSPAAVAMRWMLGWCAVAIVTGFASWLAWLALVAASMSGASLREAVDVDVLAVVLARTTFGRVWIVRSACLLALAACLAMTRRSDRPGAAQLESAAACLALVVLLTMAGAGHAVGGAPSERAAHVVVDALHLLGAGTWLGALVPLLFVLSRAAAASDPAWQALSVAVVRRFSALGVVAVLLLLGSGLLNAAWLVGSWAGLGSTPYGRLVGIKVMLFVLIVAIAAVNRLRLAPRLAAPPAQAGAVRALRRNVIAELIIGVIVVAVVGWLGVMPPAAHEHTDGMGSMIGHANGRDVDHARP
jgi:putative copper resistance protein D